jgi:Tol biopolymer transport system component
LTDSDGRVVDFAVSVDGRQIAYSLRNEEGGSDLYRMDSDGGGQARLIACGKDLCQQLAWSPNGY